ncbi:MAG: hypothetical protein HQ481_08480 [Alphaproteobacteria bacterium]|nr:hypothetical protein [Alphaproteobacteria bacterium]
MTLFVQNNAVGAGTGSVDGSQASVDLAIIANGDTGLGLNAAIGNRQQVAYARTLNGPPPQRLDTLANTAFTPDYGAGPQAVNIAILPVLSDFFLNDGTPIVNVGGTALAPPGSGIPGNTLNNTTDCLVIYDTTQADGAGYCSARAGNSGVFDLQNTNPTILYHELSHAFRIVNNTFLTLTAACDPASTEEAAAIADENDLRTQIAAANGTTAVLRDTTTHCGNYCSAGTIISCCIIASVASQSPMSEEVQALRAVRDQFLRRTEVGFAFFQTLFHDYYGFSPQVSTMMARQPALSSLVLEGFVRPLLITLRLLQAYAFDALTDVQLGRRFVEYHDDQARAAGTLDLIDRARGIADGGTMSADQMAAGLAELLRDKAWPSEHVQWALIAPVAMYRDALSAYLEGDPPYRIGQSLRRVFTDWAAEMPLDHAWASLSARQLRRELTLFETRLLRSARARTRFRRRLAERFQDITAIRSVLGRRSVRGAVS